VNDRRTGSIGARLERYSDALVHIHVIESQRTPAQLARLADSVQDVMLENFDAPDRDRYQIITEHKRGQIIAEDTGLGFERTDDIVIAPLL
jgi:hypothetical protein